MAGDEDEYVRRRVLMVLADFCSLYIEQLALAAWHRSHENQQWARMAALSSLHRIQSPSLDELLTDAKADPRSGVSTFHEYCRALMILLPELRSIPFVAALGFLPNAATFFIAGGMGTIPDNGHSAGLNL